MSARKFHNDRYSIVLIIASMVAGCAGAGEGAVKGAAGGALAGAAGGLVQSLIWGGDPGEYMARGAAVGATVGAVGGAVEGSSRARAEEEQKARQEQQELDAIRRDIGHDAFNAIVALVDCEQEVAIANARVAARSTNSNHALAGLWIQALSFAETGDDAGLQAITPDIVRWDREISDAEQFDRELKNAYQDLVDIRAEYRLPLSCAG